MNTNIWTNHTAELKRLSSHMRLDEACATENATPRKTMCDTGNICKHGLTFAASCAFISKSPIIKSSYSIRGSCSVVSSLPLSAAQHQPCKTITAQPPNLIKNHHPRRYLLEGACLSAKSSSDHGYLDPTRNLASSEEAGQKGSRFYRAEAACVDLSRNSLALGSGVGTVTNGSSQGT